MGQNCTTALERNMPGAEAWNAMFSYSLKSNKKLLSWQTYYFEAIQYCQRAIQSKYHTPVSTNVLFFNPQLNVKPQVTQ